VTAEIAEETMRIFRIDSFGLTDADRSYLRALCVNYGGGPVGPKSIAASTGLDLAGIEQAVEPWLLRAGLVVRTRLGRKAAPQAFAHLGLPVPETPNPDWEAADDG